MAEGGGRKAVVGERAKGAGIRIKMKIKKGRGRRTEDGRLRAVGLSKCPISDLPSSICGLGERGQAGDLTPWTDQVWFPI